MKTVELTCLNARWEKIRREMSGLANVDERIVDRIYKVAKAHGGKLEPYHGPIAMLKTGAKLYWSDSRGVCIISGYAYDGRDVNPYLYQDVCGRQ